MTHESLADRLVNYADAIAAFAVVNSLAFLVGLTSSEIRCSLYDQESLVIYGQVFFALLMTLVVVFIRRVEIRVRQAGAKSGEPVVDDILRYMRAFFVVRIVVIWGAAIAILLLARMALTDPACAI